MINWKVRLRNKAFWLTAIPQALLVAQLIVGFISQYVYPLGFSITEDMISGFMGIVNVLLLFLGTMGVVIDPTTPGLKDSFNVLTKR